MVDIRPFRALRPKRDLAKAVAAPPYDVLDSSEARVLVAQNPHSFLHVTKSEVDLPEDTHLYSDQVYAKARQNLAKMIDDGVLAFDSEETFYVYRQRMNGREQTGIVAGTSVAEYNEGVIKKHEKTRQGKEDDRTRHILETGANTGPVFMTYRASSAIDEIVDSVCVAEPDVDFVADDQIAHTIWVIRDESKVNALQSAFEKVPALYIADGHHRSASAARVAQIKRDQNLAHTGDEPYNYFMSVIFPDSQLRILDYNRLVKDLNGLSPEDFLTQLGAEFEVETIPKARPAEKYEFTMFLGDQWYRLRLKNAVDTTDPVASLDVSILQDRVLAPILGIGDPRLDERIDFVGGIRGMDELERRVKGGMAVAFAVFPASMDELLNIADASEIMPPKSTWFEPKLRSGLIIRTIE